MERPIPESTASQMRRGFRQEAFKGIRVGLITAAIYLGIRFTNSDNYTTTPEPQPPIVAKEIQDIQDPHKYFVHIPKSDNPHHYISN